MSLVDKYNVAVPRYTSYPTVPAWTNTPSEEEWKALVKTCFVNTNATNGISLYIHLPFCESLCTYCACNTRITVNHNVETPYIEALLKEWRMYLKLFDELPRLRELHLGGGTPTFFSPANLAYLVSELLKTVEKCETYDFSFEGHPGNTSAEHLQALYDLGFRRVSFGIQDFDVTVQRVINRYQSYQSVEAIVEKARRIGYTSVNFDLVYGLPLQTSDTMQNTLQKVIDLKPDRIAFYSYAHVPWLKPGQRSYTEKDLPQGTDKIKLYHQGRDLFTASGYADIGLDHFAFQQDALYTAMQKKKLHRNFMGYTNQYTQFMLSLGVSAISDTWNAFAQNIKDVETYQKTLEEGKLPIFKGHALSADDELIRKHILDIMCKGETQWVPDNLNEVVSAALVKCESLSDDGLIHIFPGKLVVTQQGKAFLRNICACFDAHYRVHSQAKRLFSAAV